jgi:hypothetical protein
VRVVGYAAALGCALALLAFPRASFGADPPNPNDPCSNAGRNTCGTLGVGYYKTYRYGLRWFGDFRAAVPGEAHVLHRPRLLVPVPVLSLPRVDRPAPQPERRAGLRAESTEDGVRDLAVRPQQRCGPAGGRDAVRALADGRRPAGGSGPRGARPAGRRPLRPRRTRRRSAARPVPSRHRRPRGARRRQAGDGHDSAPFRDRRGRPGRAARSNGRRRPRPAEVRGHRHGRHRARPVHARSCEPAPYGSRLRARVDAAARPQPDGPGCSPQRPAPDRVVLADGDRRGGGVGRQDTAPRLERGRTGDDRRRRGEPRPDHRQGRTGELARRHRRAGLRPLRVGGRDPLRRDAGREEHDRRTRPGRLHDPAGQARPGRALRVRRGRLG